MTSQNLKSNEAEISMCDRVRQPKSQVAAPVNTITCTLEVSVGTMLRVVSQAVGAQDEGLGFRWFSMGVGA